MNTLLKNFLLVLSELLDTYPSEADTIRSLKDKADSFKLHIARNDGVEAADLVGLVLTKAALVIPPLSLPEKALFRGLIVPEPKPADQNTDEPVTIIDPDPNDVIGSPIPAVPAETADPDPQVETEPIV